MKAPFDFSISSSSPSPLLSLVIDCELHNSAASSPSTIYNWTSTSVTDYLTTMRFVSVLSILALASSGTSDSVLRVFISRIDFLDQFSRFPSPNLDAARTALVTYLFEWVCLARAFRWLYSFPPLGTYPWTRAYRGPWLWQILCSRGWTRAYSRARTCRWTGMRQILRPRSWTRAHSGASAWACRGARLWQILCSWAGGWTRASPRTYSRTRWGAWMRQVLRTRTRPS